MGNYQDRLPMLGEDVNTAALSHAALARYVEPTSIHNDPTQDKIIKLHGVSGSVIHVWARCDPTGVFTTPSVVVPMNQWLLINYVMWRYMTDDAANPGAAAAALQAYDKLREQEISRVNNMPVWFNSGDPYANSEWQER
jgi:hypothetical protein